VHSFVMCVQNDFSEPVVRLETVLVSIWAHMTKLLGDVGHMESHFGLFGDSVTLDTR
jgi:hypothetical protein